MRIAYVTETYPPEVNGVALTVERCVRHMRRNGHAVLLVRPRQPHEGPIDSRCEWRTAGLRIPLYQDLRMGLAWPGSLRHRFDVFEADLVHVATPGPLGWAALSAARALGLPVTTDFRTNFDLYCRHYGVGFASSLVQQGLRRFHNLAAATFVPCHQLRDDLRGRGFERVEVISRGVDAQRFSPAHRSTELRLRWGASAETPVLLYVGRLAAEKNVPLALRAFEALREKLPRARMVVVGDGPLRSRLQAAHPEVHFAGAQHGEVLAAHYASADLFVFPSLSETFGNVVLEAMASALGVVAFDDAGAAELIRDGRNGLLVRPGDDAGFIAAVTRLADGSVDAAALRQRARQVALARDWEPLLQSFEHRLQQLAWVSAAGHAPQAAAGELA